MGCARDLERRRDLLPQAASWAWRTWAGSGSKGRPPTGGTPSYGGGVFLRLLTTSAVLHGVFAHSHQGDRFYVNLGFGI